jgi:hypothetical protein
MILIGTFVVKNLEDSAILPATSLRHFFLKTKTLLKSLKTK